MYVNLYFKQYLPNYRSVVIESVKNKENLYAKNILHLFIDGYTA